MLCDVIVELVQQPDIMQNVVYDEPSDLFINRVSDPSALALTLNRSNSTPNSEKSLLLEIVTEVGDNKVVTRRSLGDASQRQSYRSSSDSSSQGQGRGHESVPLLPPRATTTLDIQGRHVTGSGPPIDAEASVCARMTSAGGRITLPNSGTNNIIVHTHHELILLHSQFLCSVLIGRV